MRPTTTLFRLVLPTAVVAAGVLATGGLAAASELPDDLAFLDNETIDDAVAGAENASADCAALSVFMGIGFVAGFAAMADDDEGVPTAEQFFAISAPVLVPLLHRASEPSDPAMAEFVVQLRDELTGAIGELQDLGLTDEDLLLIQSSMASELAGGLGDDESAEVPATTELPAGTEERFEAVLDHDFESITFLDDSGDDGDDGGDGTSMPGDDSVLPWSDECPETVSMFDFDMDPVEVDVTLSGTIPIDTIG